MGRRRSKSGLDGLIEFAVLLGFIGATQVVKAALKPSTPPRVQPKPSTKEEKSAALIAVMMAGVFLLFAIGMDWKYILGAIAVTGVLILLITTTTPKPTKFSSEKVIPKFITVSKPRTVELSQEQRLRYEWATQNNFWGTASHDERTFLINQTETLERQYQDYLRQKMEQGFIGPETIEAQTIENVKEAKQNLWKK